MAANRPSLRRNCRKIGHFSLLTVDSNQWLKSLFYESISNTSNIFAEAARDIPEVEWRFGSFTLKSESKIIVNI
jgi:hypothetical protein